MKKRESDLFYLYMDKYLNTIHSIKISTQIFHSHRSENFREGENPLAMN